MQDLREVSGAFFEKARNMFMSRRFAVARPARAAWFYQADEFTSHTRGRLVILSLQEPLIAMAGILTSQAAFRERCADCGLTATEIDGLIAKGVTSMSVLACTLTTPGVTPDEASLRGLLNFASPGDVTVQTLASIRHLVFGVKP